MSWNPLKKYSKPTKPLYYDETVKNLERLETVTRKLYKESKKYEENILEIGRNEKKMTMDLSSSVLCQEEEKLRHLVEGWHSFACGISKADEELVANLHLILIEPIKRFQGVFPEIKFALRKQDAMQQDCVKMQVKVQRMQTKEGTGNNIVKLESAKQSLEQTLSQEKAMQSVLKEELPAIYERRVEYFQPTIDALIRSEVNHWGETTRIFNELIRDVPKQITELDYKQRERLALLQGLSIVAMT